MTKSTIRITLRKPQMTRHVCPTSSRTATYNYDCEAASIVAFVRVKSWAECLVRDAIKDGSGDEMEQAPHSVVLELEVTSLEDGDIIQHFVCATMSCHQVCLLSRYLSRFDQKVALRRRRRDVGSIPWQLIPYSFLPLAVRRMDPSYQDDTVSEDL